MAETLRFELVTPEKLAYSAPVDMVEIPGVQGDFGVLPGHAPFVSIIRPGVVTVHEEGKQHRIFIHGGYAEVHQESCIVLAEYTDSLDGIDREEAGRRLEAARRQLERADTELEKTRATKAITVAEALVHAVS